MLILLFEVGEDSSETEGQKTALPLDRNVVPPVSQPLEEAIVRIHSPENTLNPVRKVHRFFFFKKRENTSLVVYSYFEDCLSGYRN